jgi:hypothetical protein
MSLSSIVGNSHASADRQHTNNNAPLYVKIAGGFNYFADLWREKNF